MVIFGIITLTLFTIEIERHRFISVNLDFTEVDYVICYNHGFGPKKLEYSTNKKVIDELCDNLTGEYKCVKIWNGRRDSNGISRISFYSASGSEIDTIYYVGKFICTKSGVQEFYYLYQHKEDDLNFEAFEEALDLYGEAI